MNQVKLVMSGDLGAKVCEALGIDPGTVGRIIIDINAGDPVMVYTQVLATDKLLDIDWGGIIKGGVVVKQESQ